MNLKMFPGKYKLCEKELNRAAEAAFSEHGLEDSQVELIIVSQKKIRELNHKYRAINRATDVLSFVIEKKPLIGQVFICYTIANKQAILQGKETNEEILDLFIHGLVHLLGHDHKTEIEERKMQKIEKALIKRSRMAENLIFLGPPGSGKGTQIEKLTKYLEAQIISSGDIVRSLAEKSSAIREIMQKGELVDDKTIFEEIKSKISKIEFDVGLIFDGFPRNINQAKELNGILKDNKRSLNHVIYVRLDEDEVVKRLTIRRVCAKCGQPLFDLETCPKCGGEAIIRQDDNEKTIRTRMKVFIAQTKPLVTYYKKTNLLVEINGKQTIEDVARDIKGAINCG